MSPTLLVEEEQLAMAELWLDGDSYHHLFRVRRSRAGDAIRLTDGQGRAVWGVVERVERQRALISMGEAAPTNEPSRRVDLAVAALRPERAAWLVEKATELGVASIRFFGCERSPRSYGERTLARLRRMAVGALEQSHRSRLPQVEGVFPAEAALEWVGSAERAILLQPGADAPLAGLQAGHALAVVGPEGGLSAAEVEAMLAAGAVPASLVESILRVETAALAAAAWLLVDGRC